MKNLLVKDKKFYKTLLVIAGPIILQNIITIGVNMMDTIMLGSFGETQLSGSSLANDFINIFQICCMGMGCGAAVLTAQYWGSKDILNFKKAVTIMLRFMLGIASLFTVLTIFFPEVIMSIYTDVPEVIEKGTIYLRWSVLTFILMGISLTLTQILRSMKSVNIPLIASIITFITNIFFNWVFIFGKFGMPRMEIAGAALGTVISRVFEACMIGGYFFFKDKKISYRLKDLKVDTTDLTKKYFKYSFPVLESDLLLALGNSAVSIVVGHMGKYFTAAYAIIAVLQRLVMVFTSGIGQAAHTITGNRVGKGQNEEAYNEAITMICIVTILGLISAIVVRIVGPIMVTFYDIVEETYVVALEMINAVSFMMVFQAIQMLLTKGVLRGGGDTAFCLKIDAVFLWLVSVPLGYLTGIVLNMNAFIVFVALKSEWIIKTILGLKRVLSKKWIKSLV